MRFAIEPTQADLKVTIECGRYGDSQRVGVSVNGAPLTQLTIEKDGKHLREYLVCPVCGARATRITDIPAR